MIQQAVWYNCEISSARITVIEVNYDGERKMPAGLLYDCVDAELLSQWHKAKDLARDYNRTDFAKAQQKEAILNELLGGKGANLWITSPFLIDYGNNI